MVFFAFPGFLMFQCNLNILVHVFDNTSYWQHLLWLHPRLILTELTLGSSMRWTGTKFSSNPGVMTCVQLRLYSCRRNTTFSRHPFSFLTLKFSHLLHYFYCGITDVIVCGFFYNENTDCSSACSLCQFVFPQQDWCHSQWPSLGTDDRPSPDDFIFSSLEVMSFFSLWVFNFNFTKL